MSSPPHAALTSEWKKTTHIWLEVVKGGETVEDGEVVLMRTLYNHAAYVPSLYHWISGPSRWECDDYSVGVTAGDFWKIYVR